MRDILNIKRDNSRIRSILESIASREMAITRHNLDLLSRIMESYSISVSNCRLRYGSAIPVLYSDDAAMFERDFVRLANRLSKINEGFYNPFSSGDDVKLETPAYRYEPGTGVKLHGIAAWNPSKSQKIGRVGKSVKAFTPFMAGDIIEKAPMILIDRSDMYSRGIRSIAMRLSPNGLDYAIPFGYVPFYLDSKDTRRKPNAKLEIHMDGDDLSVHVIATDTIHKGDDIIISRGKAFDNEYVPGDFEYPKGTDPVYSVKNIRIV